jgi:hypothetical protein
MFGCGTWYNLHGDSEVKQKDLSESQHRPILKISITKVLVKILQHSLE